MKITKLGHACLVLEEAGKKLVLDPGAYTEALNDIQDVVAVVITHAHDDHCFEAQLDALLATNPDLVIYGPPQVKTRLAKYNTVAVFHGDHYPVGPFTVEFFGDLHAEIHRSIPISENRGVLINDRLYYPGDSFTLPDRPVEVLAVPTSAPWLKISEVMDFVSAIQHKISFATHNALLSDLGQNLPNSRIKVITEAQGGEFHYLLPSESITV